MLFSTQNTKLAEAHVSTLNNISLLNMSNNTSI